MGHIAVQMTKIIRPLPVQYVMANADASITFQIVYSCDTWNYIFLRFISSNKEVCIPPLAFWSSSLNMVLITGESSVWMNKCRGEKREEK